MENKCIQDKLIAISRPHPLLRGPHALCFGVIVEKAPPRIFWIHRRYMSLEPPQKYWRGAIDCLHKQYRMYEAKGQGQPVPQLIIFVKTLTGTGGFMIPRGWVEGLDKQIRKNEGWWSDLSRLAL